MKVAAVVSTKGGPGKTTAGVNLGAFCADARIRTLLIDQVISQNCIPDLSLIHSNDPFNQLGNLLLHAAEGRLRFKNLLPAFERGFDLILVDTQEARALVDSCSGACDTATAAGESVGLYIASLGEGVTGICLFAIQGNDVFASYRRSVFERASFFR